MNSVWIFYSLFNVFAKRENLIVQCFADFRESELVQLSEKLDPLECLQLVQAMHEVIPIKMGRAAEKGSSKGCLLKLEEWNNKFPENVKPGGRSTMEMTLRWMGRADLAKYVRENRRSIKFSDRMDGDIAANTLEFPGHRVSRRHVHKNGKHSSVIKKKKKKRQRGHSHNSATRNKGIRKGTVNDARTAASHKQHHMKKKDNGAHHSVYYEKRQSICCVILFGLLFCAVCIFVVLFIRRRKRAKAINSGSNSDFFGKRNSKGSFFDFNEWRRRSRRDFCICTNGDIENAYANSFIPQACKCHRVSSDFSNKKQETTVCVKKPRKNKKKKKKKKRLSFFLDKNFHGKKEEKDRENQNRKLQRSFEKNELNKRDKVLSFFRGNRRQCMCCKCAVKSKEEVIRKKKMDCEDTAVQLKPKRKNEKEVRIMEKPTEITCLKVCTRNTCERRNPSRKVQ